MRSRVLTRSPLPRPLPTEPASDRLAGKARAEFVPLLATEFRVPTVAIAEEPSDAEAPRTLKSRSPGLLVPIFVVVPAALLLAPEMWLALSLLPPPRERAVTVGT